ncbi:MAG: Ribonuclease R [Chlamydiae bacterium]|nr:Ribonuclease R [Chlamydiota bacterium]
MIKKHLSTTFCGLFHSSKQGYGFVEIDSKHFPEDIFIPRHLTMNAMDLDIVEVEILSKKKKGLDGKVVQIIKRAKKTLVATVTHKQGALYQGFVTSLGEDKPVLIQTKQSLKPKTRVFLEIKDYGSKTEPILCTLKQVLGSIEDASIDIDVALMEASIRTEFPNSCVKLAKSFNKPDKNEIKKRLDLRSLVTFTIDPKTAKDFDDALSIEKTKKGMCLYVHIADVANYIKPNSPLDIEAKKRCNSTYLPNTVVPMIPFELSNNLCSLKPLEDRLCQTIIMHFDAKGTLIKHQIKRTVIHSNCRFTYEEVKAIIDGKKHTYRPQIMQLLELIRFFKKQRAKRGSIEFGIEEAKIQVDSKGKPTGVEVIEYDISHQLVEECMLKANEIVATHLSSLQKKLIYRVHEEPTLEDFENFLQMASILGHKTNKHLSAKTVGHILSEVKDSALLKVLAVQYIKSLKLAVYSPDNLGHFGLALENYCHFTSPIRRYSDLIVQRILFNEHDASHDLEKIAKLCSEKERVSQKCEQSVSLLKKLRLLQQKYQKDPHFQHQAIITNIKPVGIAFEVQGVFLSGFIHISELTSDFLDYNAKRQCLIGKKTHTQFRAFDSIYLILKGVDLTFQKAYWEFIG